jgi:Ca2+-binding RTX toxin-like protein
MLVANRGDDTVSDLRQEKGSGYLAGTIPVGKEPVDLAIGGALNTVFVANRGSDDVTILEPDYDENGRVVSYSAAQTLPAGDGPVAIFAGRSFAGRGDLVVVNQNSDTISTFRRKSTPDLAYEPIGEYEVGDRPTAVVPITLNQDQKTDYLVTNSGSNDVSMMISQSNGNLEEAGRIEVGRRPSAIATIEFTQFFSPDIAVANAGDGTISILAYKETSATCLGHPARLKVLTPRNDSTNGSLDPDRIRGLAGDDVLLGGRGGDCIESGTGDDLAIGGAEADHILGGTGSDRLDGRRGSDILRGGAGDDQLCESNAVDSSGTCWSEYGAFEFRPAPNRLYGGPGADRIVSDTARDRIYGGTGPDRIKADDKFRDLIVCGPGRDVVRADLKDRLFDCEVIRR